MTLRLDETAANVFVRVLAEGGGNSDGTHHDDHHDDSHGGFGVHITFLQLYQSVVFITAILAAGKFAAAIKMPSLVGEIIVGIVLGPNLFNFVWNPEAFHMLGEIGLLLLVVEVGIDIDVTTLKLIGARGISIAIVGSVLPIVIGIGVAFAIGTDTKGAIAAGAAFGPTSLGIAINILKGAKIVNTPLGQLIIAAAIIDDMIAIVILSQLGALTGEVTVKSIVIPIVSAFLFLIVGGYIAVFQLPNVLDRFVFSKVADKNKGNASLTVMFALVVGLMPATKYSKASPLMGCFIAGLVFCSNHAAHHHFVSQMKRLLQWLMKIFFAATIGFQVPVKSFADGRVIGNGCLFTLALLGKLFTGLMVPNFTPNKRYTGLHMRDVLVVGFSMAAEGEFAFIIAVFAVTEGIIGEKLYASIVLAILLSTILAPFALRLTIAKYNKVTEKKIKDAEEMETKRMLSEVEDDEETKNLDKSTIFLCIQTHSDSGWGLLPRLMSSMMKLGLEIIDHRSWNPRGLNTTLINEIYVTDSVKLGAGQELDDRLFVVQSAILEAISQPTAKVKVHRWFPGIVEEIVEETIMDEDGTIRTIHKKEINVRERILQEAQMLMEEDKQKMLSATKEKTVEEIVGKVTFAKDSSMPEASENKIGGPTPRRRTRHKTFSTPIVGGADMFAESATENLPEGTTSVEIPTLVKKVKPEVSTLTLIAEEPSQSSQPNTTVRKRRIKTMSTPASGGVFATNSRSSLVNFGGKKSPKKEQTVKVIIDGNVYNVLLKSSAVDRIVASSTMSQIAPEDISVSRYAIDPHASVDTKLGGFVRRQESSKDAGDVWRRKSIRFNLPTVIDEP